jgi:lipase
MRDASIPVPGGEINVWHRPPRDDAGTAVLVHGLSGNSRWWGPVIDGFPEDLGVVALDVRGRGLSIDSPPPYDFTTVADDISRALDHLGTRSAVVAGYSMGGWVAAMFGVRHPTRVDRLVLVDGGLPLPREPGADVEEIIEAIVGPSLRRLDMEFESEDSFFDQWKRHPALADYWDDSMKTALGHELTEADGRYRVRASEEAIEQTAREMTIGEEANTAVARLTVPTRLIVVERGTSDQPGGMIPLDAAQRSAQTHDHVTMEYLPDLNHYTLLLGKGAPAVASAIAGEPR